MTGSKCCLRCRNMRLEPNTRPSNSYASHPFITCQVPEERWQETSGYFVRHLREVPWRHSNSALVELVPRAVCYLLEPEHETPCACAARALYGEPEDTGCLRVAKCPMYTDVTLLHDDDGEGETP
jgi:hypothetical protein